MKTLGCIVVIFTVLVLVYGMIIFIVPFMRKNNDKEEALILATKGWLYI